MPKYQFDFLVFIGRFQPIHNGHMSVIYSAFEKADKLILLCGSAECASSAKDPWSFTERKAMISSCFSADENARIIILPLIDMPGQDDLWVEYTKETVYQVTGEDKKIGLIGYKKDDSSYYLNLFPDWEFVPTENYQNISATLIRENLYANSLNNIKNLVPDPIMKMLRSHNVQLKKL